MKLDSSKLKDICVSVLFEKPKKNLQLAHELIRLMHKERGMGLAANQVGYNVRLFVMRVEQRYWHCFNPEILEQSSEEVELEEGCLSFPREFCKITRPEKIFVRYFDAWGNLKEEWLEGWASRCFQHEFDHLNGLTMYQRQ